MPTQAPGLKVLLQGKSGTGKTTCAIDILMQTELEVYVLMTEPGQATINKAIRDKKPTEEQLKRLHLSYIAAGKVGFSALRDRAKKVNTMSFQALASLGDIDKQKYGQFINVLDMLADFTDLEGNSHGAVDEWDNTKCLFVDSMSGLNIMAMDLVAGGKPAKNVSDWGIAQDNLRRLIQMLCMGCECWVFMTAHVEMERDEVTGKIELMPATLGRKLGPELPHFFDDVLYVYRDGKDYFISNEEDKITVKHRGFPLGGKLQFKNTIGPVYENWKQ